MTIDLTHMLVTGAIVLGVLWALNHSRVLNGASKPKKVLVPTLQICSESLSLVMQAACLKPTPQWPSGTSVLARTRWRPQRPSAQSQTALEERRAAGDFTIHQKAFEDAFWRYFTTDSMHDFCEPGSKEEAEALKTSPWEQAAADAGKKTPVGTR